MLSSLWFVTPAWRRLDVSRVCFAQRAAACEQLRELGVDATCVVIADDENLELAREHGFATVERPNDGLGGKFNAGYLFAAAEGVDYVCPVGSDSWLDPGFIAANLPGVDERVVVCSPHYAVVRADGRTRLQVHVTAEGGVSMFYPTSILRSCGWQPIPREAPRGCDGYTLKAIRAGGPVEFRVVEQHPLETVAWQSDQQITSYTALRDKWGVGETHRPFARLERHYPAELVQAMRDLYADRSA